MVDLKNRIITINGRNHKIIKFDVWWHGPMGFYTEIDEAITAAEVLELDPNLTIRAIPVAVAENDVYEPLGG